MNQSIGAGSTLTQAFEKHSRVFPEFFTKMIRVGETTGRLEQVAASLSSYYEQRYDIARTARHELYPILAYFGLLMGAILVIESIKNPTAALEKYSETLPWVILAGMAVWAAYYFSQGFRDALGRLLFHVPFVNRLARKFSLSKFCEGMRLASEAGLDVNAAIKLSAEGAGNAAFRKRVLRACDHIEKGASISESLERTAVFPLQALQMFTVGEETGKLHEAMGHVSKHARGEALAALRTALVLGIRALYVLLLIYIAFKVVGFWTGHYRRILEGL